MEVDFETCGILEDTVEVDESNDSVEGERCGICMDIIIDRGVLDCCQHWFCFGCIDNWATITNLCPLCQNEFQLITCVPVYDTIGNNKVDEDSFSRDDDWCIEGKSSILSFPSYYIDENVVICLNGDGCKIRCGSATIKEDSNLDTSIACDSCDIWYHAFCVGFDPEGTSEDTWLCPRCAVDEIPQQFNITSVQRPNNPCVSKSSHGSLADATFSGKVSVTVADAGETALVVSMVGGTNLTKEPKTLSCEENGIQSILEERGLELSLSHDKSSCQPSSSLILSELPTSCADEAIEEPSSTGGVANSLRNLFNDSCAITKMSESDSSLGLHLALSMGSISPVDDFKNYETEDQVTGNVQQQSLSEELLLRDEKIVTGANEEAVKISGLKRKHRHCSDDEDDEANTKGGTSFFSKKIKTKEKLQMTAEDQNDAVLPNASQKCPPQIAVPNDVKLELSSERKDITSDIMTIVQGADRRSSKGLACRSRANKSSKERENAVGLRVKKIMRRDVEDKETSVVVQKLRKEIREAVHDKSSAHIGENLFDPKLLAAFRTAVAGHTTEPVKRLPPSALKAKKSMLQKGKVRENLTKKIYGDSNGRRKRAWDRDHEVEFWKHRCMKVTKPEKIATLKSVLNLLRKNPEGSEVEQASECQATNPILSRLYLADTSVFPRNDDIKPLSVLTATNNSEQNKTHLILMEKGLKSSHDDDTSKFSETTKVSSKLSFPSAHDKRFKDKVRSAKGKAASGEAHLDRGLEGSPLGGAKVNLENETGVKSNEMVDKRKWALEMLARKMAVAGKNSVHEKQENHAVHKGNYPLLAQLPLDMRPSLATSRHNKIPVSVRLTQLYHLTEHFLRKLNLLEICRTGDTELAVADAINIEKEVADKSNSKTVYLNLCSQQILHRPDNCGATEANSSPVSTVPDDGSEQPSDEYPIDPSVTDALRKAGLLSDSPQSSPQCKVEVPCEENDSSMHLKVEGPANVFEMDSHPEMDIYGDFEYDLEDEDFFGATAMKIYSQVPEESKSRMKVVFSTFKSESLNNVQDSGEHRRLVTGEESKGFPSSVKSHIDTGIISSTMEVRAYQSCLPPESLQGEEGNEPSLAECEELYGPDKDPLINRFPEEASRKLYGLIDAAPHAENDVNGKDECSDGAKLPSHSQRREKLPKKDKFNTNADPDADTDKHCEVVYSVSKKVEAYIKEHIRPLCKSGVITAEQYRWAIAKATDKVMKYHSNARNANFLIKEGEKVKKLVEQYVEAAQQKGKN